MTEQTLLLIKPNAVQKGHIGEIIAIIEKHQFEILAIKSFRFDLPLAHKFYEEHIGKEFFHRLVCCWKNRTQWIYCVTWWV
jgi:nucleoside-diphosphate kinase